MVKAIIKHPKFEMLKPQAIKGSLCGIRFS